MASLVSYIRLEPRPFQRNFEAGFSASIHDPAWFLARQWQMGEHQGENASSPIWVNYEMLSRKIKSADDRFDPQIIPAEAIVESELFDWWTMGRRIRIGKKLAQHPSVKNKPELRFTNPAPPYEHFIDHVDGLAVWKKRADLALADDNFGVDIPADSTPAWNSRELIYQQTDLNAFTCDENNLTVNRHRGGRLDWYSVDATSGVGAPEPITENGEAIPTVLQYPGAPNTRWWQIENAEVDMGGYVPDSSHTPTALLTDLIFSHSDDWFLFPILAKAGNMVAIDNLVVLDTFGRTYTSTDVNEANELLWTGLQPPNDWTLFKVSGLTPKDLILWHVAELPLESSALEKVQFGSDEQSNLVWAVERTVDGRDVQSVKEEIPDITDQKFNAGTPKGNALPGQEIEYAYVPAKGIAPYWYPYEVDESSELRQLVQRSLPDLSLQKPKRMPLPKAETLQPDSPGTPHTVNPLAIPANGIELERRWHLARDMNGIPVIWLQRKRSPLLSPPARLLRFDVMEVANF
jgi:hypothetical protein